MLVCMLLGSLLSCFYRALFHSLRVFARFNVESPQMWTTTGCGGAHTFISHLNLYAIASTLSFCELSVRWKKLRNSTCLFFVCVKDWNIQPEITRKIEPATNEARSEIFDIKWEGMTIKEFRTLFSMFRGEDWGDGEWKIWYLVECDCYEILITTEIEKCFCVFFVCVSDGFGWLGGNTKEKKNGVVGRRSEEREREMLMLSSYANQLHNKQPFYSIVWIPFGTNRDDGCCGFVSLPQKDEQQPIPHQQFLSLFCLLSLVFFDLNCFNF